jgi:hypothetical protein
MPVILLHGNRTRRETGDVSMKDFTAYVGCSPVFTSLEAHLTGCIQKIGCVSSMWLMMPRIRFTWLSCYIGDVEPSIAAFIF